MGASPSRSGRVVVRQCSRLPRGRPRLELRRQGAGAAARLLLRCATRAHHRTAALSHVVSDDALRRSSPQAGTDRDRAGRRGRLRHANRPPVRAGSFSPRARPAVRRASGWPRGKCSASASALAEATGAGADDRYLSLLPSALLLEQIAGIYVPLSVGAAVHLPDGSFGGPQSGLHRRHGRGRRNRPRPCWSLNCSRPGCAN